MKTCDSISFKISSNFDSISTAVNSILNFLSNTESTLSNEVSFDIKVILNELLINAVKHGNNCDLTKSVDITAALTDDRFIKLVVKDEGTGYDTGRATHKDGSDSEELEICKLDECGRGMLIVHSLSDKVIITDSGSRIEVYKKL